MTCDSYVTMGVMVLVLFTLHLHLVKTMQRSAAVIFPFVQLVDSKGEMTKETPYAGTFCRKKADPEVLVIWKQKASFCTLKFEHSSYPCCWRCNTWLIYYARESWFIKMTAVKDHLDCNNTINWIPESTVWSFWRLADKRSGLGT